jgi:hypothetical protein
MTTLFTAAHPRWQCPIGPPELGLSIKRARRSFLARRRRRETLAILATAAQNSGEVEIAAVVAETPKAPSPSLKRLNREAEVQEGMLAELLLWFGGRWCCGTHARR